MLRPTLLIKEEEVKQAQELLHDVYISEMNWSFPQNNLSGLAIVNDQIPRLSDQFSEDALWFGCWDDLASKPQLIACHRARVKKKEHFELSLYSDLSYLPSQNEPFAELNRLAVKKQYRNFKTVQLLLALEFQILYSLGVKGLVGSASSPVLLRLFRQAGFEVVPDIKAFKFHAYDPYEARVILNSNYHNRFLSTRLKDVELSNEQIRTELAKMKVAQAK